MATFRLSISWNLVPQYTVNNLHVDSRRLGHQIFSKNVLNTYSKLSNRVTISRLIGQATIIADWHWIGTIPKGMLTFQCLDTLKRHFRSSYTILQPQHAPYKRISPKIWWEGTVALPPSSLPLLDKKRYEAYPYHQWHIFILWKRCWSVHPPCM